jgi:hypothetical protein
LNLRQRLAVLAVAGTMTAGMAAVAGTAASAAPAAPGRSAGVVSGSTRLTPEAAKLATGTGVDAQQRALAAYWTPARMMAAKPDSELPSVKAGAAHNNKKTSGATKPQGTAQRVSGAAPTVEPKVTSPGSAPSSGISPMAYYPNYPVGHPVASTSGKVFFTSFGVNYVCSGGIVNTEGKSEVWTAGHCVSDGGAWNYNWVFVPNYVAGWAPYGYWYSYQLWTTSAWFYNNGDFANDVGSSVMWRNNGWRITDYLGGQGIAWNYPIGYYMYAFGYPAAYPFDGNYLVAEEGYTYDGGGGTIYMVNYMTGGSSGGYWLNWFDGNWGYINGHNDFKYTAYPQYMFSPYYGNQVGSLYNAVRYIST